MDAQELPIFVRDHKENILGSLRAARAEREALAIKERGNSCWDSYDTIRGVVSQFFLSITPDAETEITSPEIVVGHVTDPDLGQGIVKAAVVSLNRRGSHELWGSNSRFKVEYHFEERGVDNPISVPLPPEMFAAYLNEDASARGGAVALFHDDQWTEDLVMQAELELQDMKALAFRTFTFLVECVNNRDLNPDLPTIELPSLGQLQPAT